MRSRRHRPLRTSRAFHPALGVAERLKAGVLPIEIVGAAGRQQQAETIEAGIGGDRLHETLADPGTALRFVDEHVADSAERRLVRDDTGEAHLAIAAQGTEAE